jgi:hypothetical protein
VHRGDQRHFRRFTGHAQTLIKRPQHGVAPYRGGDTSARPVREYLQALDAGNPAHEGGAKYLSPTDPAAAWNTKEGRGRFGYFTNYMVDTAHAVIIDVEATPARMAQEIKATKAMLDRIEKRHGIKPERLAADTAYGTGPFLAWLNQRQVTPHIPVRDYQHVSGLLPRAAFTFDSERNVFICPQGKILKYRTARHKEKIHMYRATAGDCKMCSIRQQCTRGPKRTLSVPSMKPSGKTLLPFRRRKPSKTHDACARRSEMLFAHMKQHFRFTRLKLRGLAGAAEEFLLVATIQNLRRLIRLRRPDIPRPCGAATS